MKWLHETLHLHTGDNHSCYHPLPKHIPLEEIENNPSALHNTAWKKEQRKKMLEGVRPDECQYCWNIEDLPGEHISDRAIHSASDYSVPIIDNVAKLPWDQDINPRYLEISFSNSCNFRCGYCGPRFSTQWIAEVKEHGNYDLKYDQYNLKWMNENTYYGPKDANPYVDAFWKWWPELKKDLHTLRITGGEPLLSPDAMRVLDMLDEDPAPHLEININSNLGVSADRVERLITKARKLISENKIKTIKVYTSMDSWGAQAEYMRTGLDCTLWESNVRKILDTGSSVSLMCTYNVLCVTNFTQLLDKVIEFRKDYGVDKIKFDTPYLKTPWFWMMNILTEDFIPYMDNTLQYMKDRPEWFSEFEYEKFKRVVDYMRANNVSPIIIEKGRRDFYSFFNENDRRLGTNLLEVFPEYKNFYNLCKEVYEKST
jgi:organic radical activating enzyme